MPAVPGHRLQRFAWMLALVVVLRFAAWELHHAFDVHAADEHCEICAVVERSGAAPAAQHAQAAVPVPGTRLLPPAETLLTAPYAASPLPRGPPRLEA